MLARVSGARSLNGGAFAGLRGNVNGALQLVQHGAHHVHADAAAGNFGDCGGGAETGLENKIERFLIGEALASSCFQNSLLDGLRAELRTDPCRGRRRALR